MNQPELEVMAVCNKLITFYLVFKLIGQFSADECRLVKVGVNFSALSYMKGCPIKISKGEFATKFPLTYF